GYINPRSLVRAQLQIAAGQGATIIRDVVVRVEQSTQAVTVTTQTGEKFTAARLLIANGAYTNSFGLLPHPLALRIKSETTLHARVPPDEAERLGAMPTVVYEIESPTLDGIYLAPPIRYPDGNDYIKLGCDTIADKILPDLAAMNAWMQQGDSDVVADDIRDALLAIMPGLQARSFASKRCLVTYTPHRKPYIDQLDERLFIATGGNGSSAKCSDTLGYLAAGLLLDQPWPDDFDRHEFRVLYATDHKMFEQQA
ncbi:MAG: FAD-binding oxidoreductase, partial [Chloroflexota bacterium]|nr:FAD-binding oxidoreductase [Chloroflexota bacterium]